MSKNFWLPVIISLGILFSLNLLMISSLAPQLLLKQIISWIIGIILFIIGTQINPRQIVSSKTYIFICSCVALLAPIILNNITRGSRRWVDIGIGTLQPSELVKPWLMLFLVNTNFPLLILIPVGIIALQPDLGSAISVLLLLIPIILYNSKILKTSLIICLILAIFSPLIWNFALHDYQKNRIINFIDPQTDPLGKGYNVIQSKIAIGSGGIWGKGYRKGSQGQLLFLPEKHTDFMFAATAEELGLAGALVILAAYFILIKALFDKAFTINQDRQLFLFTLGIAFQIWAQAFINIGMNIGFLPVTGIPLPFLSVGGSSIMALMFSLGIIFSS
jgi:rod shape determining protein RodA